MESSIVIDKMRDTDWERVRDIYIEGIQTGNATFETVAPKWEEWDQGHLNECRLVVRENGEVIGWGALSPISRRAAYNGVAEVSIYFSMNSVGKGIGSRLLKRIIDDSEENGFWTLQANIFPENAVSIHLHEKHGFEIVGTRKRIGKLNGVWRDVVLMERRSKIVGMD
ncbi:GNAT family N-acetyltransferase [Ornithinibacillus sp. L9]|uniref:GNAT family N-acetyltransferase n=1 Tax=Ornithinibacillus caprae TaxID=2678566 RepID=A0A6N8FNM2_9BACI|nr:GNAT family N-acetyltransferase [Ornithinibacillus caprae]MUK89389.1 GNAT family N-acetyltransferase [Ornithinibacillus caprae]